VIVKRNKCNMHCGGQEEEAAAECSSNYGGAGEGEVPF
jgi:hypothetical protein